MKRSMLIIGLGTVGFPSLELLAQNPEFSKHHSRVVACSLDEATGIRRVNTARTLAQVNGLFPNIEFQRIDLLNVSETAEILKRYEPSLIFANATLLRSGTFGFLPPDLASKIREAGLGFLVPCHIALIYKLMLSIKEAGIKPLVINSSIPDITGPMLRKKGIGFEVGIGNIANYAPRLRYILRRKLKVHPEKIKLYWYMHHSGIAKIATTGTTGGVPYILRIYIGEKDVTSLFDPSNEIMKTQDIGWPYLLKVSDHNYNHITAMSAYRTVMSIWNDSSSTFYAPSPRGLPGGYTVTLGNEGAESILPDDVSIEDAIEVNEVGSRLDGVERIEDDGTLVLTEKACHIVKEALDLDLKTVRIDNCEKMASELLSRFEELAERYGAKMNTH